MSRRKPAFNFEFDRIEISSEEILADLLYPARQVSPKATPEQEPHRPFRP
jgi:hypothetical protein